MRNEKTDEEKHPIDMTSDELLDHVFPRKLADKLREIAHENDDESEEPDLED